MPRDFYSEQELMTMPLPVLRGVDVDNPAQQELVQKVVNRRLSTLPPSQPVVRRDVPDIETPEDERKWQEIINQRTAKLRPSLMEIEGSGDSEPQLSEADLAEEETPAPSAPTASIESGLAKESGTGKPVTLTSTVSANLKRNTKKK